MFWPRVLKKLLEITKNIKKETNVTKELRETFLADSNALQDLLNFFPFSSIGNLLYSGEYSRTSPSLHLILFKYKINIPFVSAFVVTLFVLFPETPGSNNNSRR